ncbi:hypothetical protein GGS20DRAFT_533586 [Poronia punctata]|nr:hypothetical protein GGS20DRAFT_533586 [Poronia punctata]
MDDQFNGRTDDDLFADDFEPISDSVTEVQTIEVIDSPPESVAVEVQPVATPSPQPAQSAAPNNAPKSLAHSRHAPSQQRPQKRQPKKAGSSHNRPSAPPSDPTAAFDPAANNAPTAPATTTTPARPGSNTALVDRLASGGNPRAKLSDTELAEKMERMRILSAEKARKFEQAEKDSRSHAIAYEKGMEEVRRRRAEEAERRRKNEADRRQMDQERVANRERKLKAMEGKEGGWDKGKMAEDDLHQRGFRSANGGIRGSRTPRNFEGDRLVREFAPDEFRGNSRGRGRGGPRGGRGGRGGFAERNIAEPTGTQQQQPPKPEQKPPSADDFPALPPASEALSAPLVGKWDDEMAALDAKDT